MYEAVLIILWLASGQSKELIVEFADSCETMQMLHETNDLWVSDYDLPRQHPVSVECRCLLLDEEIEGEVL